MKIGVLDTDGYFTDSFFVNKKITIMHDCCNISERKEDEINGFTHGELVCSHIMKENPSAEIVLIPIINNGKCSVLSMLNGIQRLIDANVDIINLSIGDEYKYHKELEYLCYEAWKRGILIVAAHSNNAVLATYPASFSFVLGVRCINKEKTDEVMKYNEEENDITFSSQGFSIYHLGISRLVAGNSFACAKITGLLSHQKDHYTYLNRFLKSKLNTYYAYKLLKKKRCIFLSNRITEALEQRFVQEVTNSILVISFEKGLDKLEKEEIKKDSYEIVFIDHNDFEKVILYKPRIMNLLLRADKEIVIRYPLFSLSERLEYHEKEDIIINQFYI